jgi:hypothetical protein
MLVVTLSNATALEKGVVSPRQSSILAAGGPQDLRVLRARLGSEASRGRVPLSNLEQLIANVVVSQMLPGGAIKGGTSLMLRLGVGKSRFSQDLDICLPRTTSENEYIASLQENLALGWEGFTGTAIPTVHEAPRGMPSQYVMCPYTVRLSYKGEAFCGVTLELVIDEIDSIRSADSMIHPSLVKIFGGVGLREPAACALLSIEHQMVQKIHGCAVLAKGGFNARSHDLVDMQLLMQCGDMDQGELKNAARRLFALRRQGAWPALVREVPGWLELYDEAALGLGVLSLPEAIIWANMMIATLSRV